MRPCLKVQINLSQGVTLLALVQARLAMLPELR